MNTSIRINLVNVLLVFFSLILISLAPLTAVSRFFRYLRIIRGTYLPFGATTGDCAFRNARGLAHGGTR